MNGGDGRICPDVLQTYLTPTSILDETFPIFYLYLYYTTIWHRCQAKSFQVCGGISPVSTRFCFLYVRRKSPAIVTLEFRIVFVVYCGYCEFFKCEWSVKCFSVPGNINSTPSPGTKVHFVELNSFHLRTIGELSLVFGPCRLA